jgi:peroxiredoxin
MPETALTTTVRRPDDIDPEVTKMSIEDELAEQRRTADAVRSVGDQAVRRAAIDEVRRSGLVDRSLGIGQDVPPIVLPDATGGVVDVADLLARGPVVISFYRGGWCPYCNIELRGLQQRLPDIRRFGATLVAISPEPPDASMTTRERNELEFPVLSDVHNRVARRFGIVHQIDPQVVELQLGNGVDVAAINGDGLAEVPLAATYVVDQGGVVRFAAADPDYTRRPAPDDVVAALEALYGQDPRRCPVSTGGVGGADHD